MLRGAIVGGVLGLAAAGGAMAGPPARPAPHPDLSGVWTNAWYTDLQRPKEFKALVATPAEAEAYEAPRRALNGMIVDADDKLGQAASEFNDKGPGLARIRGEIRTSWIVDPADGKIPYTQETKARLNIGKEPVEKYDNIEDRPTDERCLTARGAGAPILNSPDTNLIQIVQTPGDIVIVSEKNHDARIIRMGGDARPAPRDWMGVSVGRWRGATLVVETTGRRLGVTRAAGINLSGGARVVEEFTRTGPAEITYRFYVEDFSLYTRPWRAEMVFRPAEGRLYEVACHEGNYSLPSILSAARQAERAPPAAPTEVAAKGTP
jgi:hypothetical protein